MLKRELLGLTPLAGSPDPTGTYGPFVFTSIPFEGTAKSVAIVNRSPEGVYYDNVELGAALHVPEPAAGIWAAAVLICWAKRNARAQKRRL
jgi:hypothetical protein